MFLSEPIPFNPQTNDNLLQNPVIGLGIKLFVNSEFCQYLSSTRHINREELFAIWFTFRDLFCCQAIQELNHSLEGYVFSDLWVNSYNSSVQNLWLQPSDLLETWQDT